MVKQYFPVFEVYSNKEETYMHF